MIDQRIDYIHMNPVKAGIVANPEDYLYSSARNYAEMDNLMEIDNIENFDFHSFIIMAIIKSGKSKFRQL